MNKLISFTQKSYGTYTCIIEDADGDRHTVRTNEVEAIDRIREAGRDMASNNDGTYEALRNELADSLALVNNI
jgi:hypothetical protein